MFKVANTKIISCRNVTLEETIMQRKLHVLVISIIIFDVISIIVVVVIAHFAASSMALTDLN